MAKTHCWPESADPRLYKVSKTSYASEVESKRFDTGDIAAGIQSGGGQACLKHFVCNEAETSRQSYDVQVDDRVLREIYLRPFEIAVKEASPASIMSAYNSIVSHRP